MKIHEITHPDYDKEIEKWNKFRLTMEGGRKFLEHYLYKYSIRESDEEFRERLKISYCAAHSKAAILDIINSIYQRLVDITRQGGPSSYNTGFVDFDGNNMTSFIGRLVLPELLSIRKVGVFVDKPPVPENGTLQDAKNIRPYLYHYEAHDIRSWAFHPDTNELVAILLRDHIDEIDEEYGLVKETTEQYRLLTLRDNSVLVRLFDKDGEETTEQPVELKITKIPFHIFEISHSLLNDVADHQIALTNVSSSDVQYILKANFPFYVEQFSPIAELPYVRQAISDADQQEVTTTNLTTTHGVQGTAKQGSRAKDKEIRTGAVAGRRYPQGLNAPEFIHPSPEPLMASMDKAKEMKEEIRQLVNLAITTIEPRRASAESKKQDNLSLEAGLSKIGLELQYGEQRIAEIWAEYEKAKPATVKYPSTYSLRSDSERREEGKELREILPNIPSLTYQKEVAKQIVTVTIGTTIPDETLSKIHDEIDQAEVIVTDPEIIEKDHEQGFVTTELASKLRGYPKGESEKAKEEHAERAARILTAQTNPDNQARGIPDTGVDPKASEKEKVGKEGRS